MPLIVRAPGATASGTTAGLTEGVDVVPTLLELAGVPVPPHIQGSAFTSTLAGDADGGKACALTEMHGWKTIRTEDHRYVLRGAGEEMLFDLRDDPLAYTDLSDAPSHTDTLAEHRLLLARRAIENEQPLPKAWQY